jgi:hypothetical protein
MYLHTMFSSYRRTYYDWVSVFARSGTSIGILVGVLTAYDCGKKEAFFHIVGYASVGLITGLLYPIAIPLSALYVSMKK